MQSIQHQEPVPPTEPAASRTSRRALLRGGKLSALCSVHPVFDLMPASKEPFIATNVPSEVHERLKQRAGEHGLTLRDYCTIVLSDAVAERPSVTSPSVSERHAPLFGCSPTRQNAEYAPVKIRLRDDEAEGVPYDRLQRPPIVRDDPKLPDDPEAAAIVFARELQLVRLSSLWRQMVEEGVTEAELRSVVPD